MTGEIEVKGVILSSIPIGEYDKRVVILTDQFGKIHAFARGARKLNSKLLAGTEPLTFGTFKVFSGKSAYNLADAQIIDFFPSLKSDLDKLSYGYYILEISSYFTKENVDAIDLLRLIYVTLKAFETGKDSQPFVFLRMVFEWKLFALEGIFPSLSETTICGVKVSDTVRFALSYIERTEISKLFSFTLEENAMEEFIKLGELYHRFHIDKKFHSLEMMVRGDLT